MKRITIAFLALAAVLFAQREYRSTDTTNGPGYEVMSLMPREVTPAMYQQVDQRQISTLALQGWELVSVMPYVYKNEERGPELHGPKPMVTQTYPAYFFKRVRVPGRRE